ncbi:MAG: radical SAM family heme chaperone HemW [Acidobacteria bacterium]|nr:radical SAM family heme chaperone HemW [Acidobacteriota bacterium]NIM62412.1 radical SAM family heme chaperone HemW [Acidobacteriota bacterium]NIO60706.1 radical SAM family heme chaperone HemW [Acidobacteriota bacterium]NIQ31771.1 radical SAM family heme chaperone HemW [Acidobacteriota bacterium]NIQ87077.1 radical SAM family heme chaperone HemW [Acidobacteriota bacterium]
MSDPYAGLYLHVPFCARVCPYCDFAVRTGNAAKRHSYVESLLAEIELHAGESPTFDTIYFGGGTPSRLEPGDLDRIVARIGERLATTDDPWVFLEANPEDVTPEAAAAWKRTGVRTVSLGVQSFDAEELAFLGRTHSADRARDAIGICRETGFHTVSIDLIYGLPGQTTDAWHRRLDAAIETEPDHLACYQLTIHERTRFALLEKRGELTQMPDEGQAAVFRATHEHLNAAGYAGYEVAAFAIDPEHRSSHNMKYWNHTPYLGLGPSAHSFDGEKRWWNHRKMDPWQREIERGVKPIDSEETLSRRELLLEALMIGLRTYRGIDTADIERRFDTDLLAANRELVERLHVNGLILHHGSRLIPTLDGLAVADSLAAMFRI